MLKLLFLFNFLLFCGISKVSSLQCYSCINCNSINSNTPVAYCGSRSAAANGNTKNEIGEPELEDVINIGEQNINEENNNVKVVRAKREILEVESRADEYVCYTITYKVFNTEQKARGCAYNLANLCEYIEQQVDVKCSLCTTDKCNNATSLF